MCLCTRREGDEGRDHDHHMYRLCAIYPSGGSIRGIGSRMRYVATSRIERVI